MHYRSFYFLIFNFLVLNLAQSQNETITTLTKNTGPIIDGYGAVFPVPEIDFTIHKNDYLKVVFDVTGITDKPDQINPLIESAARFLNLHAQYGVLKENMSVALVIHGSAIKDMLTDKDYAKKYGVSNPNRDLIKALDDAGVAIYLCGQTAAKKNVAKTNVLPQVQFALSAMTALVKLQNENYRLINF